MAVVTVSRCSHARWLYYSVMDSSVDIVPVNGAQDELSDAWRATPGNRSKRPALYGTKSAYNPRAMVGLLYSVLSITLGSHGFDRGTGGD